MESSKQARLNISHGKDTGLSANQPLMHVNRSHLSHVKDPSSSAVDVIKELSLIKQLDHPCFPFVMVFV